MRKFTVFTFVLVLALALTACGRRDKAPTESVPPVTQVPTEEVTMPTIDPTLGTNIPDPEVDTSMPTLPDPTIESGNHTDSTGIGD